MQLNLDMMQTVLRQMPVLILVLTVIIQLTAAKQRRSRLVLEQSDHGRYPASDTLRLDQE